VYAYVIRKPKRGLRGLLPARLTYGSPRPLASIPSTWNSWIKPPRAPSTKPKAWTASSMT